MSNPVGTRGADRVAEALASSGVERVYSLSGNQIMPIYDALLERSIAIVHVRHEAAAVHMADAWGRLTGQPGVALLTAGPGHANGVSALYSALASESPMLLLSGHAPIGRLGQGPFQEMAQALMAAPVCKAAWTVDRAEALADDVARGLALSREGRPGPVHLSLPVDLLDARVDSWTGARAPAEPLPALTADAGERLARSLTAARRPLVIAGAAFARGAARAALEKLARASGVPCVAMESPRGLDDPDLGAFAECLAEADRVLLLARRPDFNLRYAEPPAIDAGCEFLVLEAEAETLESSASQLGERMLDGHLADPVTGALALAHAMESIAPEVDPRWRETVESARAFRPPEWRAIAPESERGIHPAPLCYALAAFLEQRPRNVLVCDGGEFGQWAQAIVRGSERLINGPSGAIGASLSYAAAAAIARPEATVLAVLGDGTVGFHLAEFDTALRAGAPFVAVVGNDACWNAEHQIQLREYGSQRLVGCELLPTRYDLAVAGLGGHGEHVTRLEELAPALERALASALPACINVRLDGQPAPTSRRGAGAGAAGSALGH